MAYVEAGRAKGKFVVSPEGHEASQAITGGTFIATGEQHD